VRGVWSRHGLLGKHDRLMRLEKASADRVVQLNEEQVAALERFSPEFRERHIEAHHSGDLVAVDTFFVGHLKAIGKVYLQTAIDCCSRFAWGRLYTNKMPLTAVHLLNTDVVPHFEEHGVPIKTVLSDNGREFCGRPDRHPYELFLQLEGIEHRKTKVRRPQSNGIVERRVARFHRTLLDEHFRVEGRRTWFETVEQMQEALDAYLVTYNTARPHQGRGMNGRPLAGPSSTASPQTTIHRRTTTGTSTRLKPPDYRSGRGDCQPITVSVHECIRAAVDLSG
jgi:transposase InsO family protein